MRCAKLKNKGVFPKDIMHILGINRNVYNHINNYEKAEERVIWNEESEEFLIQCVKEYGNNWELISRIISDKFHMKCNKDQVREKYYRIRSKYKGNVLEGGLKKKNRAGIGSSSQSEQTKERCSVCEKDLSLNLLLTNTPRADNSSTIQQLLNLPGRGKRNALRNDDSQLSNKRNPPDASGSTEINGNNERDLLTLFSPEGALCSPKGLFMLNPSLGGKEDEIMLNRSQRDCDVSIISQTSGMYACVGEKE